MKSAEIPYKKNNSVDKIYSWPMYAISAISGVSIWISISFITGTDEAWDSFFYYRYGLPLMFFITGVLGFLVPIRVWRWGVTIMASQAIFLMIQKLDANLLPLGLVLFAVLSIPCIATAYFGAFIKGKIKAR